MLQCVVVCCNCADNHVTQHHGLHTLVCVAVCCSVLQCVAIVKINMLLNTMVCRHIDVLQCAAACCSVLLCDAIVQINMLPNPMVCRCIYVLQCVAVCCSVLQCVAVCCSVLQRVSIVQIDMSQHRYLQTYMCCNVLLCNTLQHTETDHIVMRCHPMKVDSPTTA